MSWHVFKQICYSRYISRNDHFNVFSKSKACHGIIFQGKSFTITFCKPCKLFVNLWTFNFCSVQKLSNGFQKEEEKGCWPLKTAYRPWVSSLEGQGNVHFAQGTFIGKSESLWDTLEGASGLRPRLRALQAMASVLFKAWPCWHQACTSSVFPRNSA